MPIQDNEPVLDALLADAAAALFGQAPGRVWVRLRPLPAARYAAAGAGGQAFGGGLVS